MSTPPPTVAPLSTQPSTDAAASTQRPHAFNSTLQLLALCPLLAVSDTVVKAVGFSVSLLITAGLVTAAELITRAWFHDLGQSFGVFLPLLAVNIVVIDHLQAPAQDRLAQLSRSVRIALGISLTLIVLGFARELVGRGS